MKIWKRLGTMALASVITIGTLTGCGSNGGTSSKEDSDSYSLGYVNLADTDVFCMSRETALNEIIKGSDYSVSYTDGNNDNQKQLDQANAFISKGVDCLILVPSDSEAIGPAITAANQAKVPTICFGIKATSGDFVFVGSENYEAGHLQGEYMAEKLPENAKVCYLAGTAGLEHSTARRDGFKEALTEAGRDDVTILDDQDGDYTKDEGMRITDAWIQTYSDGQGGVTFNAVVAANDQMALGAMESLKGAGLLTNKGEILITGVDGTDDAITAVADGFMAQTVLQDAVGQAQAAFDTAKKLIAGEKTENEVIVPFKPITKDNVAEYQ